MKIEYKPIAIKQTQFQQVFQGQNNAKQIFYAHMFIRAKLQTYGMDQTIEHNINSFQQSKYSIFPQAFLSVYQMETHNQYYKIVSEPYTQNLLQYLANKQLNQGQALQIFSSVLKAVYSLILIGVKPVNVRPQNFIRVKNKWKLRNLVLNSNTSKSKQLSSQYIWDPNYRAPYQYLNLTFYSIKTNKQLISQDAMKDAPKQLNSQNPPNQKQKQLQTQLDLALKQIQELKEQNTKLKQDGKTVKALTNQIKLLLSDN